LNCWHFKTAAYVVKSGGILAYPTEAVYGLGCSPWNARGVARILTLKRRDPGRGLIIIAADISQLELLVDFRAGIPTEDIDRSWPGPVTWVLPARPEVPRWLKGDHDGIAVRVTAHGVTRDLCKITGPLVSTSANPEGYLPARTANRVRSYFRDQLDCIVPGKTGPGHLPTEIRHAGTGRILRRGS
jgi:L-threonylcarbamoyladenylate synthase